MKQTRKAGPRTPGALLLAASTHDSVQFRSLRRPRTAGIFAAILLISSVILPIPSVAQTPSGAQEATLDSVCRSLTEYPVTAGSFVMQRRIASLPRDLRSSGTFVICGEGIAWNTTRPLQTLLVVTGDKIIQRLPDGSTNVMDGAGNQTFQSIATTLSALFSGDRAALEENFQVSFSSSGGSWTMTLLPKDRSVASVMTTITMEGTQGLPGGSTASGSPDKTASGGGVQGGTSQTGGTQKGSGGESFLTALSIDEAGGGRITYRFSDQLHRDSLTADEKAYFTAD